MTTAEQAIEAHTALIRRRFLLTLALAALALVALFCDLITGPSSLTALDTLRGLVDPSSLTRTQSVIIFDVRLASALMAVLVGAALSLSGAELQSVLDNPLASPFTLGLASAASFGAALAIVLGIGFPGLPPDVLIASNAFLFAFLAAMLLQVLSRLRGHGADTIILFGTALVFSFNALLSLMQFMASAQALQQVVFWMMGSLARSEWSRVAILAAVIAAMLPFSLKASWRMNALRFGDERARAFGIDVSRLRFLSLLRVSILTGTAVAFVGSIGFIGLVGPHIARLLIGEDHRFFLPASALTGAILMSGASVAAKLLVPGALLPIGVVTAVVGVPVYVGLILLKRERM
ncbi:iron-siderophore ABC transporter permease [Agaricicola taiwanensis]|uniref:Iron-siderophore ABC transporter permease n=1 Tax=Agaricicola taiwanensis TaxID=591372 RepID=A0A8J2YLZ0_9RHOB|nr:iron ABC transporter permease [Agaricicola taiwanensis]GGE53986.1 iron-siderophore ABC transporter permease [Agaricicola taiwanensis]